MLLTALLLLTPTQAEPVTPVQVQAPTPPLELEPIQAEGAPLDARLEGIWRSRGYGWVLVVEDGRARMYDHGPAGSLRVAEGMEQSITTEGFFRIDGDVLVVSATPANSSYYWFDRLDRVPEGLETPPADTPEATYEYFWTLMDQHYAFFDLYGVDWDARGRAARSALSNATSERELFELMRTSLADIADGHLTLTAFLDDVEFELEDQSRTKDLDDALDEAFANQDAAVPESNRRRFFFLWRKQYLRQIRELVLGGDYEALENGQVIWGRIANIGYINVFGMGGFEGDDNRLHEDIAATHRVLSRVLTDLADCDGLIVDVSMNTGGYDQVQLAIASHFAPERVHAYSKYPAGIDGVSPQAFFVEPAEPRFTGPVTLVTSGFTVSAAETFTMAMRALPNVTHRGTRTNGALSDMLEKRLPNGWMLTMSNEVYLDPAGNHWEKLGIPPEIEVPLFDPETLDESHAWAILGISDAMRME